jgi:hypothetical protein
MIIKHWYGTDALKLSIIPPGKFTWRFRIYAERIFWKLLDPFISQHWVVHPNMIRHLEKIGIDKNKISVKLVSTKCTYCRCCKKIKHPEFNIAYYYPGDRGNPKFKRWVYGMDIVEELLKRLPSLNWIYLNGTQDMCDIFPILDMYIRPSRHDGMARLIVECEMTKTPYYWNPEFKHDIDSIEEKIKREVDKKYNLYWEQE